VRVKSSDFVPKRWYLDFFCLLLVIGLNPIIHFFNCSPWQFLPDTFAYMTMGRDLFYNGQFYIPSWSYADIGLILPPLYPFFIACGQLLFGDSLKVAEWISCTCGIMASVPIYLYIKEMTNRVFAVITVLLIQVNYYYFLIGMRPLSESTFLLAMSCTLLLTLKLFKDQSSASKKLAFILGTACGLVFLSRQIGIIVFIFLGIFSLIQILTSYGAERQKVIVKNLLFILLGWLVFLTPYTAIIFYQTGNHPFQQYFQEREIKITGVKPEALSEIKQIESLPEEDYNMIYAKRRLMRKLLPDSSEMFCRIDRNKGKKTGLLNRFISIFKNPKAYIAKIYSNTLHLRDPLGSVILFIFLVSCISPFLVKGEKAKLLRRLLLPFFIIFYLLAISCFTDVVSRYIYVLFPFVLMHIAGELFVCMSALTDAIKLKVSTVYFTCFIYILFIFVTPKFFTALNIAPKLDDIEIEYCGLREHINGEPVFSLFPLEAYLSGGAFRVLPNDSLEKVVRYGRKTGVRWLVISWIRNTESELELYTNAQWYSNPSLGKDYFNLVRFCCGSDDGKIALYEIL